MKIIGICGSPRKGNTEWMMKRVLQIVGSSDIDTELILLRKQKIKGCTGCLKCEEGGEERTGYCKTNDAMREILPELLEADAIVLGTPVYFDMLSGLMKNFMDRTCPIWTKMEGKHAAGIAVAEESIGAAIDNIKTYASMCKMNWVGEVTALAKEKEEVVGDIKASENINQLAKKIVKAMKR